MRMSQGTWMVLSAQEAGSPTFRPEDLDFFEKRIRPLLSETCFECHSHPAKKLKGGLYLDSREGFLQGGDSGPAVNLQNPGASLLLEAIHYDNVDLQMPPDSRLQDRDIEHLERWVQMGLPWTPQIGSLAAGDVGESFNLEKRRSEHWAWKPVQPSQPPEVQEAQWVKQPIDAFLKHRLEEEGLRPASAVSSAAWLRRVHVVLTGLPPTQAALDAFLQDKGMDAKKKVIEALLGSIHYGEHWARHWLDLVRYAETMGHEFDYPIPNAWRYRDYVIRSIHQDLPYDQFIMEHLAGDQLPHPRIDPSTGLNESILGTGFYWLGQQVHSPVDIQMNQLDVLDNQIDVVSKTFQGLTVSCARCHDHKFDAISARDYYGLFGIMKSSRYQQTTLLPEDRLDSDLETWEQWQEEGQQILKAAGYRVALTNRPQGAVEDRLLGDAALNAFEGWFLDDEAMRHDPFVKPGDLVHRSGDHPLQPASAHAVDSAKWSVKLQGSLRSPTFKIDRRYVHALASGRKSRINVVIDNFNLIRGPIYDGIKKNLDRDQAAWTTFDLQMWQDHEAYLEFKDTTQADLSNGGAHGPEAWFSVQTVLASNQAAPPVIEKESSKAAEVPLPEAWLALAQKYRSHSESIEISPVGLTMIEGSGRDSPIYIRGNPRRHGEAASRTYLTSLSDLAVPHEGSGRYAMARAMIDPNNPLTARVYVNRVWHHVFGKGLVRTVDDFGVLGQPPTHPELLDWLAHWFVHEAGWSTKKLIRMLVLSSAFAMDSVASSPETDSQDPENALWHRSLVRRLEAESIRDHLLLVSGQMDPEPFGTSEKIHLTAFMTGRGRPGASGPLDGSGRRSVYVEVRRNFLSPFLATFDAPIPHSTFGRRAQSNVPAQALVLMNDPFVMQQAQAWAQKVRAQTQSFAACLTGMYEQAFCRWPSQTEIREARSFLSDQVAYYEQEGQDSESAAHKAWSDLCHTLFNMKEFIYLR